MMNKKNVTTTQKEELDWVPVEERLPNADERVLITFISLLDNKTLCVETAFYDGEHWSGGDFFKIKAKVLAWKSLPKPYIPATPTIFPDEKNDFEKRINILDRVTGLSETAFHLKELYENLAPEQRDALADQFVKVLVSAKIESIPEERITVYANDPNENDIGYYVLTFSDGTDHCIIGTEHPTCEEAAEFLKSNECYEDLMFGRRIKYVREISEEEAFDEFVMEEIEEWPVFHSYPAAKFTSVYDNGSVILTVDCKVNPKTREIFEVSENPITDEHSMTIVREYVTIDGKEYPAVDSMGYPDAVDNPEVYWY